MAICWADRGWAEMNLLDAFLPDRGRIIITLVGAGGKTTAMYALGREAINKGLRVIITTTTKIYTPRPEEAKSVILDPGPGIFQAAGKALENFPLVVAGAGLTGQNKIAGVDKELVRGFLEAGADIVLVEADGAAGRPFKAPGKGEPVIPPESGLVVPVVGIDCMGRPVDDKNTHRPEMISELAGIRPGQSVTPDIVAGVYLHPRGYLKDVPPFSGWVPFINKVESVSDLGCARQLAYLLGMGGARRVVIGAARSLDPVAEVLVFDS